jgi:hypothetical protein
MTCQREASNVKRETYPVIRYSFRSSDASRFTLHEQHGQMRAGC